MSETISGSVNSNEQVENTAEAVENNGETVAGSNAEETLERYVVGDIFAYAETSSLAMVILDVVAPNNGDATYKVRLYSSVVESIIATEKEVANYIVTAKVSKEELLRQYILSTPAFDMSYFSPKKAKPKRGE